MAYVLVSNNPDKPAVLTCKLAASAESPVVNPALVIKGWGQSDAAVKVGSRDVEVRVGHNLTLDGTDLVVWIRVESDDPVEVTLSPQE